MKRFIILFLDTSSRKIHGTLNKLRQNVLEVDRLAGKDKEVDPSAEFITKSVQFGCKVSLGHFAERDLIMSRGRDVFKTRSRLLKETAGASLLTHHLPTMLILWGQGGTNS